MRGLHTAMKSGPCLPQLQKVLAQKRTPSTAKSKKIKNKNKGIPLKKKKRNELQGKKREKHKHMEVNNMLLNNQEITEEIKEESKNI